MKLEKFHIYLANLSPTRGTEPGKVRPVVVVQTDLLNNTHPSTVVCPMTTTQAREAAILRVAIPKRESGLDKDSDVLVDQIRAIDNRRFLKHIGKLTAVHQEKLLENLRTIVLE